MILLRLIVAAVSFKNNYAYNLFAHKPAYSPETIFNSGQFCSRHVVLADGMMKH